MHRDVVAKFTIHIGNVMYIMHVHNKSPHLFLYFRLGIANCDHEFSHLLTHGFNVASNLCKVYFRFMILFFGHELFPTPTLIKIGVC